MLVVIISCVLLLCESVATAYNVSASEIQALSDLFESTQGSNWAWQYPLSEYGQKWNFSTEVVDPCNHWQGVECHISENNFTGTVTALELKSYNLEGELPDSLSTLVNATVFSFDRNRLNGSIPESVGNMTWLQQLRLSYNYITGTIPLQFFMPTSNLSYLSLTQNYITGKLPDFSGPHSAALEEFFLNYNMLSGTIPETLSLLSNLKVFFVGFNHFNGSVPDSLYTLPLNRLALNSNAFTGTISANIKNLEGNIRYLYMHQNNFYGTIPPDFGELYNMVYLSLFENFLTGTFPAEFGQILHLKALAVDTNFLTGTIPSELANCLGLEQLNMYNNMFTGTIPSSFATLKKMQLLLLQSNHLTGSPGSAFNRTLQLSLESVDLSINKFSGALPDSLFGPKMLSFSAFDTCFSGRLPESICDSTLMQSLVLDGLTSACAKKIWPSIAASPETVNSIRGGIPGCIFGLPNLTTLHLSSNGLTGLIPNLPSYGNLTDLDLSFNLLSGPVPETLLGWTKLSTLNLRSNRFCGDITATSALHYSYHSGAPGTELYLSENRFSGIIPKEIQSAVNIDIVDGNMFSCQFSHLPPYNDPNGREYVCGSNLLYVSMASMAGVLGVLVVTGLMFWCVAHKMVRDYEMCGCDALDIPVTRRIVHEKLVAVFRSAQAAERLYNKIASNGSEQYKSFKGFIVRVFVWKRQVDELIANEDLRHDKVMVLAAVLKDSLLSDQSMPEGPALQALQDADIPALKSANVPHLVQFLKSLRILRNTAILVFVVQLVIEAPAFPLLKYYRGTYLYQYGWYFSGAFMSGYQPAVTVVLIWFISLSITLYVIAQYIPSRKALNYRVALQSRAYELLVMWRKQERRGDEDPSGIRELATAVVPVEVERESYSMVGLLATLSRANTVNRETEVGRSPPALEMTNPATFQQNGSNQPARGPGLKEGELPGSNSRSHTSNADSSVSSSVARQEESRKTLRGRIAYFLRESVWIAMATVLLDIAVVLTIKGAFVYALNSNLTSFGVKITIELALSMVDLAWSVMFVPYIITRLPVLKPAARMVLKIALLYFNSIIAPILAIALTQPSCFSGLFIKHDSVEEVFAFSFCALFNPFNLDECLGVASWSMSVEYTPPFLYNFNCYSNVISAYTPVFIFSYCILSLTLPVASMYISTLNKRNWFHGVVPAIFWLETKPEKEADEEVADDQDEEETELRPTMGGALIAKLRGMKAYDSSSTLASQGTEAAALEKSTAAAPAPPRKRRKRVKPKTYLFFPGFILASAIHHILVLLTFGLMLPVLGFVIVVVVVITTFTWEIVLGRYLTHSPNCNPLRWQVPTSINATCGVDTAPSSESDIGSSGARSSESSNRTTGTAATGTTCTTSATATEEEDCSGGLDALCIYVACCARKCNVIIAYGSAIVFAFATLDMASDTQFVATAIWAPITVLVLPAILIAVLTTTRVGTPDQKAYKEMCSQQATTETMMMLMRNTVMNDEVLNALPNRYSNTAENRGARKQVEESAV